MSSAPGFTSEDTSNEKSKRIPDFSLGEPAVAEDPAVVRFREAKEAREKAIQTLHLSKDSSRPPAAKMKARREFEEAQEEYEEAKKALPRRSVGRFGGTRRRNLRKRARKTRKWTSSGIRKRN